MRLDVRESVKTAARGAAQIAVAPIVLSFAIRARLHGRDRALEGSSQWLGLVPGLIGEYVRRAFLSHALAHCHETAVIGFGVRLCRAGSRLDENVYIGPGCHLGLVHLERDVMIASGVHIPSGASTHRMDDVSRPIRDQPRGETLVRIGAGAWIGERAIVMADVGRDAVVGAGAVVTRPVPAWTISAGVPARVLSLRRARTGEAV